MSGSIKTFRIFNFLKYGYYSCALPYKVVVTEEVIRLDIKQPATSGNLSTVAFHRNPLQALVCFIIYTCATFWTVIKLKNAYPEDTIYNRPSRILAVVGATFQLAYVLGYIYTVGLKTSHSKDILATGGYTSKPYPWKFKDKVVSVVLFILPNFLTFLSTFLQMRVYLLTTPGCIVATNAKTYTLLPSFDASKCSTEELIMYTLVVLLTWCAELINNCCQTFLLVLVVSGRATARECAAESDKMLVVNGKADWHINYSYMLDWIDDMRHYFKSLDKIGSALLLYFLCHLVPSTAFRFLDSVPNINRILSLSKAKESTVEENDGLEMFCNWLYFTLYAVIIHIAADAKGLVEKFRQNVTIFILKREMRTSENHGSNYAGQFQVHKHQFTFATCKYVKESLKGVCFHGGPVFQFSHGFVGTVIGIITTLTLFELQFGRNENSALTS